VHASHSLEELWSYGAIIVEKPIFAAKLIQMLHKLGFGWVIIVELNLFPEFSALYFQVWTSHSLLLGIHKLRQLRRWCPVLTLKVVLRNSPGVKHTLLRLLQPRMWYFSVVCNVQISKLRGVQAVNRSLSTCELHVVLNGRLNTCKCLHVLLHPLLNSLWQNWSI
jgi:hypothetical protein